MKRVLLFIGAVFLFVSAIGQNTAEIKRILEVTDSLYSLGKVDSALAVCREAVPLVRQEKNAGVIVSFYTSQGVYLRSSGMLPDAVESYDTALEYVDRLDMASEDDRQSAVVLYNNLSTLHMDMKSLDKSETYALRAAVLADKCTDKSFRAQIYTVTSSVFIVRKLYDKAKEYLLKAIELSHEEELFDGELNALTYYMLVLQRTGSPQSEINRYAGKADSILPQVKSVMTLINYYQILFVIRQDGKQYREVIAIADKLLSLDGIKNYPFLLYDIYNNLHSAYKNVHDYENAYTTLTQAQELNDSLFQKEKAKQLEELSVKYESKEKELEIQKLNEEKRGARQRLFIVLGGSVFVLVLSGLFFAYFVQRQRLRVERQKREMEAQRHEFEQLQRATEQKLTRNYLDKLENEHARLAKELHDGVCNDLFSMEVNAASDPVAPTKDWIANLRRIRENIRLVSHELLPPVFREATINEVISNYLESLSTPECPIRFETLPEDVEWTGLPDAMSLNIYRIIQEAVGNSLKHARASRISVVMEWKLPNLEIRVSDNGNGAATDGPGIGIQTMKERVTALKGTFTMKSTRSGTTIIVLIPVF